MGNIHCFQNRLNCSEIRFKKKKDKEISSQGSGSRVGINVITSDGGGSILGVGLFSNKIFKSGRLSNLVSCHLLVHYLKVQALQVNTSGVLDEITPQKLETFEVPTEKYSVILVSLLKSFNGPSSDGLKLVLGHQKLLVLFQC